MKRLSLLLIPLFVGTCLSAAPPAGAAPRPGASPRFEVEGSAAILRRNEAAAQQRAIENAFRGALLKSARRLLGAAAFARYRPHLEGPLLRLSSDYIRSYRLLKREVSPAARRVRVRLEVVVDLAALDDTLRSIRLARTGERQVRILFLVEESILGTAGGRAEGALHARTRRAGVVERRLMALFARAGYAVLNPRAQREPARPGQISSAVGGNLDAARLLGGLCGCQMVITARAVAERERRGVFVGLASARAIRVEDGAVVAIRSRQVRLRPRNRARGFETTLFTAGSRLARALLPEVLKALPPPARPPVPPQGR